MTMGRTGDSILPSFSFSGTVTSLDQFNNQATTYSATVQFSSSDSLAVLSNVTINNGVGTITITGCDGAML